jgi:hypothetical protein
VGFVFLHLDYFTSQDVLQAYPFCCNDSISLSLKAEQYSIVCRLGWGSRYLEAIFISAY